MAYLIWVDVVWSQQFRYRQYSFLHPLRFHRPILLKRGKCIWNCSGTDACCGEPEPLYSTQFWLPLTCLLVRSFVSCFLDDPKMGRDRGWAMGKMEHGKRKERKTLDCYISIYWLTANVDAAAVGSLFCWPFGTMRGHWWYRNRRRGWSEAESVLRKREFLQVTPTTRSDKKIHSYVTLWAHISYWCTLQWIVYLPNAVNIVDYIYVLTFCCYLRYMSKTPDVLRSSPNYKFKWSPIRVAFILTIKLFRYW